MRGRLKEVRVRVPAKDGEALAAIYREGEVLTREDNGVGIDLTARVPDPLLGRLRLRDGIRVLDVA
jgi:hypothetical protein